MITPKEYLGAVLDLCQSRRGELVDTTFLTPERVEVHYMLPLAEIVFDFFDHLKSSTRGYASLDYEPWGYQESDVVRVDVDHGRRQDADRFPLRRGTDHCAGVDLLVGRRRPVLLVA